MIIGSILILLTILILVTVFFRVLRGEPWREIKAEMKNLDKKEIPRYLIHSIRMAFSSRHQARKQARYERRCAKHQEEETPETAE